MWRKEAIPQEFKDASIIHLYKEILTSVTTTEASGKTLLNRLNVHLDQKGLIQESQSGIRKKKTEGQ